MEHWWDVLSRLVDPFDEAGDEHSILHSQTVPDCAQQGSRSGLLQDLCRSMRWRGEVEVWKRARAPAGRALETLACCLASRLEHGSWAFDTGTRRRRHLQIITYIVADLWPSKLARFLPLCCWMRCTCTASLVVTFLR